MIVPLALEHVEAVAGLHGAALTGLLKDLGPSATRAFYAGAVKSGAATGFVFLDGGAVRGFVFGSRRPDGLKGAAARANPLGLLAGTALGIARRPSCLASLARSFRGPDEGGYDARAAELTYLAVSADARKGGIGRGLVDAFSGALRAAGVPAYELSVDEANAGAAAFYESLGFAEVDRYREFGTVHRRYRLTLSPVV